LTAAADIQRLCRSALSDSEENQNGDKCVCEMPQSHYGAVTVNVTEMVVVPFSKN